MPKEPPVDLLNDSLKEIVFRRQNNKLFKKLARKTHFDYREVEALAIIHQKITQLRGPMTRLVFQKFFHSALDFTENIRHLLVDRVYSEFDKKNASQVHLDDWIEGLSIVLKGTLDERIHFAYKVYDLMKTNKLKREHLFPMMRGCLIKMPIGEDADDSVKDLIDIMLRKVDIDRDGVISEEDFTTAVKEKNILFLECMGPVFPTKLAQKAFLTTFTDRLEQTYK